jgi:hypothetical protein
MYDIAGNVMTGFSNGIQSNSSVITALNGVQGQFNAWMQGLNGMSPSLTTVGGNLMNAVVMLKGLGVSPSRSSIKVVISDAKQ